MIKYEFVTTKGRSENTGIEQSLIEADVICPKPVRVIPCGMTVSYVYVFHDKLKQWESNFHGTRIQFILCHRSTFTNSFLVRRKHMVIAKGNKRLRMMLNDKRYTYRWWLFSAYRFVKAETYAIVNVQGWKNFRLLCKDRMSEQFKLIASTIKKKIDSSWYKEAV